MGRNLGPLNIKDSYEGLVQISGSQLTDGSGSLISSLDITASNAVSASFAATASYALNVPATASYALYAEQAGTAGYSTSAGNAVSASFATTASFAINFNPLATASYADQAGTAGYAVNASSASIADTSGYAVLALTSSHALYAEQSGTSGYALTASFLPSDTDLVINSITANDATFTSASIGHLTTVTGSAVIIGDAYVIVNSSPTSRYAGIKVYESGAVVPTTASLEFDSVTNDWFYEYTGSDPTNFGVVMFGPEYATKGSPSYPTANTLTKGNGGHHLVDSSITDDGTDVVVSANISASGFVSASTYYGDGSNLQGITTDTGSLLTTASYSDPTLTFTKGDGSTFDITLSTGSNAFPYTGSAEILGTLSVTTGSDYELIVGTNVSLANTNNIVMGINNQISNGSGVHNIVLGGSDHNNNAAGTSIIAGGQGGDIVGTYGAAVIGGNNGYVSGENGATLGGYYIRVTATNGAAIGGSNNTSGHARSVVVGGQNINTTKTDQVAVPHLLVSGSVQAIDGGVILMTGSLGTGSLIDNLGQNIATGSDAVNHIVHCTQADYDAITPDANTLYVIDGSEVLGDTIVSGSLIGEVNAISVASSTGSLDCSVGNYFTLGLANAADTRLEASNIQIGQTINIKITNNATAAGTISFGPEFEFEGGTAFTATAATNAVDVVTMVSFDGTSLQTVGVKNFS